MQDGIMLKICMKLCIQPNSQWTCGYPRPLLHPSDQFITLGNVLAFTAVTPGTARVVNSLMKNNNDFNYDIMSTFIFEKLMSLGSDQMTQKNIHEIPMDPFKSRDGVENNAAFEDIFNRRITTYCMDAPYITRVGDTVVVDSEDKINVDKWLIKNFSQYKQAHHAIGGHNDGTFCPLKPGHIITAQWQIDYSNTFPDGMYT